MSGPTISPDVAASFCEGVYGIMEDRKVAMGFARRSPGHQLGQDWDLENASVATASSGTFTPRRTGFAAVVPGRERGPRGSETVVAVRGTQGSFLVSPDWQTNAAMGGMFAPGGGFVHRGFRDVEESVQRVVMQRLGDLPASRKSTVHVVGHSLGGAVANLLALRISKALNVDVKLYTFGAPRPGTDAFLRTLTTKLGAANIYRVYNQRDVVPMIPLYPYGHAAVNDNGIAVGQSAAGISFYDQHVMPSGYIPKVAGQEWRALKAASPDVINLRRVDYWLNKAADNTRIPGTAIGLRMIGFALKSILDLVGATIGTALFAAATALDLTVMAIKAGVSAIAGLKDRVMKLIGTILRWTGRAVIAPTISLTAAFLSYVLDLMFRPLAAMANAALDIFDQIR